MRTQVAILGGGPAGLLLARILGRAGVDCVVLERRSRAYVLSRIRAGVLEWGSVEILRAAGVGARMDAQGDVHAGAEFASGSSSFRVDFVEGCGRPVMVYGQTEITRDLFDAHDAAATRVIDEAGDARIHDVAANGSPYVTYTRDGVEHRLDCDFVAGCDGFHGVSRQTIPASVRQEFEKVFPFGWLGVLSHTPPVSPELIYSAHERGLALASMRGPELSRYYLQVDLDQKVEHWSDDAFWQEMRRRLPSPAAEQLIVGPSIEKSIAALRSFVCEPMQWGKLFLCGDAAHIVPPTGAKGLNLAISDVHYLSEALIAHYRDGDSSGVPNYSARALSRVWKAMRFSWWMTDLLHTPPGETPIEQKIRQAEFDYVRGSQHAQASLAENYAGLPI